MNKSLIDPYVILELSGITTDGVYTKGVVNLTILNVHVVNNDFPIEQDEILGRDFLEQT